MRVGLIIEASESKSRPEIMYLELRLNGSGELVRLWVEKTPESSQIEWGDFLVLKNSREALWTPRQSFEKCGAKPGVDFDIKLTRVGTSGLPHPERQLSH